MADRTADSTADSMVDSTAGVMVVHWAARWVATKAVTSAGHSARCLAEQKEHSLAQHLDDATAGYSAGCSELRKDP
jgi:hypothetical protein